MVPSYSNINSLKLLSPWNLQENQHVGHNRHIALRLRLAFLQAAAGVERSWWGIAKRCSRDTVWGFPGATPFHQLSTILIIIKANHNKIFLKDEYIILYIFYLYEKVQQFCAPSNMHQDMF